MEHYNTLNEYLRRKFGCKVYKLALDGGFTCPNRDGTLDTRGCIFCSGKGSGDFAAKTVEEAEKFVSAKIKEGKYIAYFQSFTATYAPVSYLEKLYTEAISHPKVLGLAIATRPDCLPEEVVELLKRLNKIKPVWVELGLQTVHEKTAKYIRRGYELHVFDDAVKRLREAGIEVVVHMILGLPGESAEMMAETARYIGKSGAEGIKFQLLHVLRGTDLAKDYEAGEFEALSLEQYIELLERCIESIPPDMTVHRITGDGAKKDLIAPLWSGDKKAVLNKINAAFNAHGLKQGSRWGK